MPPKYGSAKINESQHVHLNTLSGNLFAPTHISPPKAQGTVISLFTGAGGMEIGLEWAGYRTGICVEIDRDCRATLKKNRPDWTLFDDDGNRPAGDIRYIMPAELLLRAGLQKGEAALVTGGAPCQPFSNMGKKLGKNDPKNGDLFAHFVRIVHGTQPRGFIFENVAGIAQGKHGQIIDYMKSKFAGSGYQIAFEVLDAADYGVAQHRKRFIMIGRKSGIPVFPLPMYGNKNAALDKFSPKPDFETRPYRTVGEAFSEISIERLQSSDCIGMKHADYMIERIRMVPQGKNFKALPSELLPQCWKSGKHQGQDTFGRMEYNKPSPTIRTAGYNPTKGKYIHPIEDRGINTAEMSKLQGFPDDWRFTTASGRLSIVSIGKQIGNAVPPLLSYHIGKSIFY